jgi:hypothetical protein
MTPPSFLSHRSVASKRSEDGNAAVDFGLMMTWFYKYIAPLVLPCLIHVHPVILS